MPDIDDVLKNFGYHVLIPQDDPILLIEVRFHTAHPFELTGGKNTGVVELFVDAHVADTFGSPLKYLDNNRRSLRVDQKMVLVLRVFTITIRCIVSDIIPALHLRLKGCSLVTVAVSKESLTEINRRSKNGQIFSMN